MAKSKGPVVTKLTEEECTSLTNLQSDYNKVVNAIGSNETQLWALEARKESLKQNLAALQEHEAKLGKVLEDKYGAGTISLETGEISVAE
jgi:hypothetical protein